MGRRSVSACGPRRSRSPGARRPAENIVPGRIEDVTYTAGSIRYRVRTGPATTLTVREPSERGYALPAIGSEVTLCWRASDTLLIADED